MSSTDQIGVELFKPRLSSTFNGILKSLLFNLKYITTYIVYNFIYNKNSEHFNANFKNQYTKPWVQIQLQFAILDISNKHEGFSGNLVSFVNQFSSWIVSYVFNFLKEWSSEGDASFSLHCPVQIFQSSLLPNANFSLHFFLFNYLFIQGPCLYSQISSISGLTVLFVSKLAPETKGQIVEEMQTGMNPFPAR